MRYLFGDYELDEQLYELRRDGAPVALDRKVFDVLAYLIQNHERLVTKEELLDTLWPGQVVGEAALTRCITAARKALGDDGTKQEFIKTQYGRGYRFVAPLTPTPPVASSQHPVVSREEDLKANGENAGQAEGLRLQAAGPPPFSPFSLQPATDSLSQDSGFSTPALPSAPRRFWPQKGLVLAGVLLLVGTLSAVWYLSLPTPQPPLPTPQSLPLPDKPSIIVLPFVNLSGDPNQEYFSDGMTEEITAALSRISSLFVIARTSAFFYKGKQVTVRDISREMGVRYVLEGSVQRASDQVRIVAQLIDTTTGGHLWSERYDRPLTDIFALQDDIVQKIVW
jgi:TolB-like protein/DNA-binding winged helix-turn-helix (wHTH) protein